MQIKRKTQIIAVLTVTALIATVALLSAQGLQFRVHTATTAGTPTVIPSELNPGETRFSMVIQGDTRVFSGNSIPAHLVGQSRNAISAQNMQRQVTLSPTPAATPTNLRLGQTFGISTSGVSFDPFAAEFWQGDPNSGWQYEPLSGALNMPMDESTAHVQPTGAYHYHGLPFGLMEMSFWTSDAHSPLIGYAADGYPIYALNGVVEGDVTVMTSSYQVKSGNRPGGTQPDGAYDGAFIADYEYVAGAGSLDQCNGTVTVSADYPDGTYAYFLTDSFPYIPRCFTGTPDASFQSRPAR